MRDKRLKKALYVVLAALLSFSSCDCGGTSENNANNNNQNNSNNSNNQNNRTDMGVDTGGDAGNTACQEVPFTGNVNFKKGRRLNADFAQALGLAENEVCNELGQFACADFIHRVALGDPEPYAAGVYTPLAETTISTTLVVERMAVDSCIRRTERDLADPANAVIFKGISPGALDVNAPEVEAAIALLYQRALLRNPTETEVAQIKLFYDDVVSESPADPTREWGIATCFAILSSVESAFY